VNWSGSAARRGLGLGEQGGIEAVAELGYVHVEFVAASGSEFGGSDGSVRT
jgi:hypothetical protein